jgi:prepilin peptidase CpaA
VLQREVVLPTLILLGALFGAAMSDVQSRRVPNGLSATLFVLGMAASSMGLGVAKGMAQALGGAGMALLIWFPMFGLRLMGAGDVKLLAASGAWLGSTLMLTASGLTAILGGVLGAWWLFRRQGASSALSALMMAVRAPLILRMRPYDPRERVPYAVAIAAAVSLTWLFAVGKVARGMS